MKQLRNVSRPIEIFLLFGQRHAIATTPYFSQNITTIANNCWNLLAPIVIRGNEGILLIDFMQIY